MCSSDLFPKPVICFYRNDCRRHGRKAIPLACRYLRKMCIRDSNYIWLVFGITGFLISMLAMFFWQLPILFMVLLLMGMGTTLTGLVIGYKTVTICGTLGALSSIGCLFYPGLNQILIFAPVFIFMMVIPGHVLNHAARKQKKS